MPKANKPNYIKFYLPKSGEQYVLSDEFIDADYYGRALNSEEFNRFVKWSARDVSGKQTFNYRLHLTEPSMIQTDDADKGELWRSAILVSDHDKHAVDRIVKEVSDKSTDVITSIINTIKTSNDLNNPDVVLLLNNDYTIENKLKLIELVLSQIHIPIQQVHTLQLKKSKGQVLNYWVRSYIELSNNEDKIQSKSCCHWYYFNPLNGDMGLPNDQFIWWIGDEQIISFDNGIGIGVYFTID